MKRLLLIIASLVACGSSHARGEDQPPDAARERVELAKRVYKGRIARGLQLRLDPPATRPQTAEDPLLNEGMAEDLHLWSIRWMEAERDATTDQTGRVAAAQAHLDRMKTVESGKMVRKELADHPLVKDLDERKIPLVDSGVNELREVRPNDAQRYLDVARYFRLEAEVQLAREKAGR